MASRSEYGSQRRFKELRANCHIQNGKSTADAKGRPETVSQPLPRDSNVFGFKRRAGEPQATFQFIKRQELIAQSSAAIRPNAGELLQLFSQIITAPVVLPEVHGGEFRHARITAHR